MKPTNSQQQNQAPQAGEYTDIERELDSLRRAGLLRRMPEIDGPQAAWVKVGGRRVLNLCSNDYLGLANSRRIKQAAMQAISACGWGAGASRLVCGNLSLHRALEGEVCRFKGREAALLFNSGYCANLAVISALAQRGDAVFSDRLNHASIVDGIILSRARMFRYPHSDIGALEGLLRGATRFRRRLIVTDTVFSMDGDVARLREIAGLAQRYDCLLLADEAHASGVLGEQGRGALEYRGVSCGPRIITMGTLGKAAGSFGAYVCGARKIMDYLVNKARPFIYTTALPPAVCAAGICGLRIIREDKRRRSRLRANIAFFRRGLRERGFDVSLDPTAIIPLVAGEARKALAWSRRLFDAGVFVQAIRPPSVPQGTARLRITLMATYTRRDLMFAMDKIAKACRY